MLFLLCKWSLPVLRLTQEKTLKKRTIRCDYLSASDLNEAWSCVFVAFWRSWFNWRNPTIFLKNIRVGVRNSRDHMSHEFLHMNIHEYTKYAMFPNPYWWGISLNSMLEHVNVVHWIFIIVFCFPDWQRIIWYLVYSVGILNSSYNPLLRSQVSRRLNIFKYVSLIA